MITREGGGKERGRCACGQEEGLKLYCTVLRCTVFATHASLSTHDGLWIKRVKKSWGKERKRTNCRPLPPSEWGEKVLSSCVVVFI